MQVALLFTTADRERRIRVFTFRWPVAQTLARVFNAANAAVTASFLIKGVIDQTMSQSFQDAGQSAIDRVCAAWAKFRSVVPGMARTPGQLLLPDSLKLLPLLLAGGLRSSACRNSSAIETPLDERVAVGAALVSAPIEAIVSYMCPEAAMVYSPGCVTEEMPRVTQFSVETLRVDCIYLLDFALFSVLWVGRNVEESVLAAFALSRDGSQPSGPTPHAVACAARAFDHFQRRQAWAAPVKQWGCVCVSAQTGGAKIRPRIGDASSPWSRLVYPDKFILDRSLLHLFVEEDAREALAYGSMLTLMQRRAVQDTTQ
jgi:protein transport protein SEC24